MFRNRWLVRLAIHLFISASAVYAQDKAAEQALHIDIPTKLEKANIVVDFGHAVYLGDALFALGDIDLLTTDVRDWNAKGQIVVVFHDDAAYLKRTTPIDMS